MTATITAGHSLAALLSVFVYAPLFHVHESGGSEHTAVLHAHFPEDRHEMPSEMVWEDRDHAEAHQVDVVLLTTATAINCQVEVVDEGLPTIILQTRWGFLSPDAPRAHSPPALRSSNGYIGS